MFGEKKKKGKKRKLAMKLFLIIMFLLIYNIPQVYAGVGVTHYDYFAIYMIYFFLILPILLVITIAVEYKIIRLFF
ncbi:unnamed protein product, partial [marine sediment metagenome]